MLKRYSFAAVATLGIACAVMLALAFPPPALADIRAKRSAEQATEFPLVGIGLSEFEVDGNALNDPSVPGDDWDLLYGGGGSQQIWTGVMLDTLGTYKGGTDLDDFSTLTWDNGGAPDKADLLHAYVAVYANNHVFFGADRYGVTGTTYMGFWLLQNPVTLTWDGRTGHFVGNRTVGDILILADFTNGGGKVTVGVYKWMGVGNLSPMPVDPNISFAVVNSGPATSPWPYVPKSGTPGVFPTGAFVEGGADLGALGIQGCFTNFIAETRSSAVLNSSLQDFVFGALPTKPRISINPSPASICFGDPAVTLCSNVVPGTGAPPFSFAWTGPGISDPTDSCIVVGGGFAPGTYIYRLVATGCNGCSSDTAECTLTVNAAPTCSIDGAISVCPSATTTYTAPADMGTYAWSVTGNGSIPGASNGRTVDVLAGSACSQAYTVSLQVTSGPGCPSSCQVRVMVEDLVAPRFTTACPQDVTVECDAIPAAPAMAATDDCDTSVEIGFSEQRTGGSCPSNYVLTRTWTATDNCSNVARCVQLVTVVDTTAPRFVEALPVDATVECNMVPMPPTLTATDNCDTSVPVNYAERRADGNCPYNYTLTRTWTAIDDCRNQIQHVQVITVHDTTNPRFVEALPVDATVECSAVPGPAALTATDNCDTSVPVDYAERRADGSCPASYTLTRTWTATDDCRNQVQHVQVITVRDTVAPVITCPGDVTIECTESTEPGRTGSATAVDACDASATITHSDSREDGACPQSYDIVRRWTATDDCGNSASCTQRIRVRDTVAPVITSCPSDTQVQCRGDVPNPNAGAVIAHDNCDPDVYVYWDGDRSDGNTCPEIITRTYVAEDECGNRASCTQQIRVYDTIPPMISCPADGRTECDEEPSFGWPTASDNCDADPDITWSDATVPGTNPSEYVIVRTWTAEDNCHNRASCEQRMTVVDDTPPSISCPLNARFECDEQVVFGQATASDNCDPDPDITWSDATVPGDCDYSYDIVRTWIATDAAGNADSCEQTVTVYDATPPVLLCPTDERYECDNVGDPGRATATDNCDPDPEISSSDERVPGQCPEAYTIVRTWRAEDACGNVSTCVQRISVLDTTPPEITCPRDTSFELGEQIDYGWPVVSDNCDNEVEVTFKDVRLSGDCPLAYVIERTWHATDNCGNTASCVQRISVGDHTAPVITCPAERTFQCHETVVFGQATATDTGDPNPVITFVDREIPGRCPQSRDIERTWTATDACGNAASCVQLVHVVDNVPPQITCPTDRTFQCNQPIEFGAPAATDNCDTALEITWSDNRINGSNPQEYVIERTWRAADDCGNVASCVERVSVEDTNAPTLTGAPDGRLLCSQSVVFTEPTATDVCDPAPSIRIASDTVTPGPADCEYTYTRCWEAVDAAGNISGRVCQNIIRFEDTAAPVVVFCPADTVIESGDPVVFGEPVFSDNCPIPGQDLPELNSEMSSSVADGETTYTTCWTALDLCGNVSEECCQSITVAAPPDTAPYCTFVCWNWTAACLKDTYNHEISTPPACLRDDHFADVFPNGVVIGTHTAPGRYTATWTSPGAVERFKCGYGIPEPLTRDWVNPRNTDLGVLQAEILTLRLNREFSCAGYFEEYGYPLGQGCFGNFVVPPDGLKFAGLTVDQFLAIADRAVAGDKSALLPYGYSYFRLWSTAQYLNWLYGECNGYGGRAEASPLLTGAGDEMVADQAPQESAGALPEVFSMTGRPNPLRASVTINLALPAEGDVSVDIYDIQGRVVRMLLREHKVAGYHSVSWNGTDSYGSQVVAGVYFCRVQINGQVMAMEKLMKL
jgi:hypothetical protein